MGRYPPGQRDRAFGFRLASQMRQAPLEVFSQWGRQYGNLTHIRVAWLHVYLINHPDLIREVLVTKRDHFRKLPRQTRILSRHAARQTHLTRRCSRNSPSTRNGIP